MERSDNEGYIEVLVSCKQNNVYLYNWLFREEKKMRSGRLIKGIQSKKEKRKEKFPK